MGIGYWEKFKQEEVKGLYEKTKQDNNSRMTGTLSALKKICIFSILYFKLYILKGPGETLQF